MSVLKLFGSEAEQRAFENALTAAGPDGLIHPATTGPTRAMNLDHYFASWFERYARSFGGTIAGGTSEIQRNIIAQQVLGYRGASSECHGRERAYLYAASGRVALHDSTLAQR